MVVELKCPRCSYGFAAAPDCPADEIHERLTEDGPWLALGAGEIFEDMIHSALLGRGCIRCPECRQPMRVGEESLNSGVMLNA